MEKNEVEKKIFEQLEKNTKELNKWIDKNKEIEKYKKFLELIF